MFCSKCGNQLLEGAMFCQKCGTRVIFEDVSQQVVEKIKINDFADRQPMMEASANSGEAQIHSAHQKRKSKKFPVILGIVALIIVAIFIVLNWEGKIDYIATVKAHTPFAVSQGLPYTYEEVLNKYFDSLEWKVREEKEAHYVDISGIFKEEGSQFALTIKVSANTDDPDGVLIEPISVTLGDMQASTKDETVIILYNLFCMYDNGYEISEISKEEDTVLQSEISLTETFIDEDSGISFLYPSEWKVLDSSSEFHIVEMIDSRNTPDHIATFNVNIIFDQDPYGVYTQDKTLVQETVNEYGKFLGLEDMQLGDIPAMVLKYRSEGLRGDDIVTIFWYKVGEEIYQVTCSCTASTVDIYEPIFDAIMSSYKVSSSVPANSDIGVNAPNVDIRFNDIFVEELLSSSAVELVQRFGGSYYANGDGGISYDEIEFYMLNDETVGYIWSFYPKCFSINGKALNVNEEGVIYSDEIIELLGTDYEDESLPSGYYMTYYYPTYSISFGVNKFSEVSDIRIYNLTTGNSDSSGNVSGTYQEPIENYWKISGSYSDSIGYTTLSLSIYSSKEEGEKAIGTAVLYTGNEETYLGEIIPVKKGVYKIEAVTGDEIILEESEGENIILQLYENGEYIDSYRMIEHYES